MKRLLLGIIFWTLAQTTSASLIYDLDIGGSGSGQITFQDALGTDASGIGAFDLSFVNSIGNAVFEVNDIAEISWEIDSGALVDFMLLTDPVAVNSDEMLLFLQTPVATIDFTVPSCDGLSNVSVSDPIGIGWVAVRCDGDLQEHFVSAGDLEISTVPEPTTVALMVIGLADIGYRRHRSQKTS